MTSRLIRWAAWVGRLTGYRRWLAAFLFGICATLTLAPIFAFPLLLPAFSGLFALLQGAHSRRQMFWDGWWWGWGYYMSGLYWFCVALLTDAEKFAWLIPFALFGLTGIIALYSGVACLLFSFARVRGLSRLCFFAVLWTVVEWVRAHILSGFPWNMIGYSMGFSTLSLQLASVIGIEGLTLLSVLTGLIPAMLLAGARGKRAAFATAAVLLLGMVWGAFRLSSFSPDTVAGVRLRLVQANISQHHKWDPDRQLQAMKEHARLMLSPGSDDITHFIWPETAVPYVLQPHSPLAGLLGQALPKNAYLLTGSLRSEGDEENWQIWNGLSVVDASGTIVGNYDKQRLVPFGEFQPLRAYVPKDWMTPVGDKDFSWGQGQSVYRWPGLPAVRPLICYEAIFPELAQDARPDAKWLLNVTNDAWFGISSGPHQHFHMARMRAVEQGLPLVRVGNTGISAVIDAGGRILAQLPLGTQGVLDSGLPKPLESGTLYSIWRNLIMPLVLLWGVILLWRSRNARK